MTRACCKPSGEPLTPSEGDVLIVTVGNPNVGKTTLINAISGASLHIGNWPGTTVERMETHFEYSASQSEPIHVDLVDLPGAYGLAASTAEERLTRDELLASIPHAIVDVVDSGNLERNLALTLELLELGCPVVMAFNLIDEAVAKGMKPNVEALSRAIGIPVIATVAVREEGVNDLVPTAVEAKSGTYHVRYSPAIEEAVDDLCKYIDHKAKRWLALAGLMGEDLCSIGAESAFVKGAEAPERAANQKGALAFCTQELLDRVAYHRRKFAEEGVDLFLSIIDSRCRAARELAVLGQPVPAGVHRLTQHIDHLVLHHWLGIPVFLLGMMILFRFTFVFSSPWVDFLNTFKDVLVGWSAGLPLPGLLRSFLMGGVLEGLGTVLAFTPVLFVMYFALSFMEASGFLARSAFLVDRIMKIMGLPGKAFIPMLVGFGCNVPGIAATKTLESFSERLRVSLSVPFASCSARLTVFTFFAAIFFPRHAALVIFMLYALGVVLGLITILLLGHILKTDDVGSVMELPPYRIPTLKVLWNQASSRTMAFLKGAGGAILAAVAVVWLLLNLPASGENSYFAALSHKLVFFTSTFGVNDWRLAGALLPSFVAKEVVIGTLAVSYLGPETPQVITFVDGLMQLYSALVQALWGTVCAVPQIIGLPEIGGSSVVEAPVGLSANLAKSIDSAGALAYMVFVLLYMPCVATLSALKQEFGWKWASFSAAYSLVSAWLIAMLVSIIPW